jgi:hypothetical protein
VVYPSCVDVLIAIAYFSIVYCFTCMKTHIASEIELGEVVYKEKSFVDYTWSQICPPITVI